MNWILLTVWVAMVARRSLGAYQEYDDSHQQHGRYQGPPVVPVILPGGFIADTEEVAKAKDLHFNAFAHAASAVKDSRYNSAEDGGAYSQPRYTQAAPAHQRTYNAPEYTHVASQHEYSGAQQEYSGAQQDYNGAQQEYSGAQHSYSGVQQPHRQQDYNVPSPQYTGQLSRAGASYAGAKPAVSYQPSYSSKPRYQGPPVVPVILPNGYIAETADVEAAKEHHFQLVAKAQAAVARAQERVKIKNYGYTAPAYSQDEDDGSQYDQPEQQYNQVYQEAPRAPLYNKPARQPYHGPPAVPVILPSGHIADTAEVAAAKISHLQQLLDAAQKSQPHNYHTSR